MHVLTNKQQTTPPLLSIFILSAAALAYEVLMIRMFSIVHWHHFAFMVISIALLGYGASGTFITIFRRWLLSNYERVFIANILLFALSSVVCFVAVQHLPFNSLEILWDSSQWQRLLLSYLLLTLPFFFVANAIALTIMLFHQKIPLVYGIDLIGAGIGAFVAERGVAARVVALAPSSGRGVDVPVLGPSPMSRATLVALRREIQHAGVTIGYGSWTLPACAAATIASAMRSFTLLIGLPDSSLARTSACVSKSLFMRTRGVPPIRSVMLSWILPLMFPSPASGAG